MASLSSLISRIFHQAWDRYGRPQLEVVHSISEWTLPTGFTYDPSIDDIRNAQGVKLTNLPLYQVMSYIPIVPVSPSADAQIVVVGGAVSAGEVEVGIRGSDRETVRSAFAVRMSGDWYNVVDVGTNPVGAGSAWCRVRLERRM